MAPRKLTPKDCACGCGGTTKTGDFMLGHDQRLRAAIEKAVGGLLNLKHIVEQHTGESIMFTAMSTNQNNKKVCPECGHVFQGNGWDGIDAHWKSKHENIMPYSEAWPLIKAGKYTLRK